MLLGLMAVVTVVMQMVSTQERGSNVLRQGSTKHVQSEIVTTRTRAFLSCESGDMVVKVNFTQPFKGLMYAYRSRQSPCKINGGGGLYYQLRIPLKGCGTWQESPRVFVNNITIRFHQALELEEDETKTVVCRYPPPLTPPPGNIHIITPVTPKPGGATRVRNAGISEVEILIIICLLLFFSLLTVGIGIAYFCLKRRNIHLIRRKIPSSAPASQLTKLSSGTPLQSSVLSGSILEHMVRIPRAIPYSASVRPNTASDRFYEQDEETTESPAVSRDSLESSPTTSTTSGGSAEEWLRRGMASCHTLLTIPKAILRKDDNRRRTLLHQRNSTAITTVVEEINRSEELEDQTITTLLEPEYGDSSSNRDGTSSNLQKPDVAPVYAKVEKRKQRVRIMEGAQVMNTKIEQNSFSTSSNATKEYHTNSGIEKRGDVIIDKAGMKILDEVISSRFTSIPNINGDLNSRSESSETKWKKTSHSLEKPFFSTEEKLENLDKTDDLFISQLPSHQNSNISTHSAHVQSDSDFHVISDEKNLCIQDISDVYVTTTVETKSTEIRTTITRDIIEEHVKDAKINKGIEITDTNKFTEPIFIDTSVARKDTELSNVFGLFNESNKISEINTSEQLSVIRNAENVYKKSVDSEDLKESNSKPPPPPTEGWNVIIRQKKPPEPKNLFPKEEDETDSSKPALHFDVKIRTIPPKSLELSHDENTTDRRDSTELVDVPILEMPHSIEKLRRVMAQMNPQGESNELTTENNDSEKDSKDTKTLDSEETATPSSKTVWWSDKPDPPVTRYTPEPTAYLTSSDSFRSETSLRERSSSEVLEKAPTLISNRELERTALERSTSCNRELEHPALERSTSEIITSSEDHSLWIKDIPVLQSYSPDFLANIPVVTKGGFFHDPISDKSTRNDTKEAGTDSKLQT